MVHRGYGGGHRSAAQRNLSGQSSVPAIRSLSLSTLSQGYRHRSRTNLYFERENFEWLTGEELTWWAAQLGR